MEPMEHDPGLRHMKELLNLLFILQLIYFNLVRLKDYQSCRLSAEGNSCIIEL